MQLKRAMHPASAEDLELLKKNKFKEPNFPYVVFKGTFYEVVDDKKVSQEELDKFAEDGHPNRKPFIGVATITVKGVMNRFEILDTRFIKPKGFKVVTWGAFPDENSELAKSLRDGPSSPSPWAILHEKLKRHVTGETKRTEEIRALEKKVAELEAQAKKKNA